MRRIRFLLSSGLQLLVVALLAMALQAGARVGVPVSVTAHAHVSGKLVESDATHASLVTADDRSTDHHASTGQGAHVPCVTEHAPQEDHHATGTADGCCAFGCSGLLALTFQTVALWSPLRPIAHGLRHEPILRASRQAQQERPPRA